MTSSYDFDGAALHDDLDDIDAYDDVSSGAAADMDMDALMAQSAITSMSGIVRVVGGASNGFGSRAAATRLQRFGYTYAGVHGWLSLAVCVVGIISSLLVVVVLTRRHMVSSTNYMLTALAVADLLTMVWYVPYAVQYYCRYGNRPSADRDTLGWARFCIVYANVSVVAHTTSIWIAVALSAYRYSVVRRSTDTRIGGSGGGASSGSGNAGELRTSRFIVGAVCLSSVVVLMPNYMTLTISERPAAYSNRTIHFVQSTFDRADATSFDLAVGRLNFWVHALVVKLVPCVLMSVFGCLLVGTVRRHSQHRKQLRSVGRNGKKSDTGCGYSAPSSVAPPRGGNGPRTTAMLVSVIVLFLVTELPQGVLALVCGIHGEYFDSLYTPLGDLMDMVALVNNAINFVLYCTMSRQFRLTFLQLFAGRRRSALRLSLSTTPLKSCAVAQNCVIVIGDNDRKLSRAAAGQEPEVNQKLDGQSG